MDARKGNAGDLKRNTRGGRTPARGLTPPRHIPRPYYATMSVLLVHSRDGGWVDGPLRASVLLHESRMFLKLLVFPV